jgi:sugar phosphate isomerase/epimerase
LDASEVREEVVKALVRAVERVQEVGLKLMLENEHECNVGTGAEVGWILDRISSPSFGLIWDPGNEAMMGSEPFPGGYSHDRGRVTHVHLKDVEDEGN